MAVKFKKYFICTVVLRGLKILKGRADACTENRNPISGNQACIFLLLAQDFDTTTVTVERKCIVFALLFTRWSYGSLSPLINPDLICLLPVAQLRAFTGATPNIVLPTRHITRNGIILSIQNDKYRFTYLFLFWTLCHPKKQRSHELIPDQVMATWLLHPLATSKLMLVIRILLTTLCTLTFSLAFIAGIISR